MLCLNFFSLNLPYKFILRQHITYFEYIYVTHCVSKCSTAQDCTCMFYNVVHLCVTKYEQYCTKLAALPNTSESLFMCHKIWAVLHDNCCITKYIRKYNSLLCNHVYGKLCHIVHYCSILHLIILCFNFFFTFYVLWVQSRSTL